MPLLEEFAEWVKSVAPTLHVQYSALETVHFPFTLTCSFSRPAQDEESLVVQVSVHHEPEAATARVDVSTGAGIVLMARPTRVLAETGIVPRSQDEDDIVEDLRTLLKDARNSNAVQAALG